MQRHWWTGLAICLGLVGCAPEPTAPIAGTPAGATCGPSQRVCLRCDGSGTFCAPRCPSCAPPLAPAADSLALASSADRCHSLL